MLFTLVWVVCSGLHPAAGADGGPEQPNLIYILADDLGYGDLSCYGQTRLATPQLDSMAAAGLKFTRHYAGSTVCAPSRCVLLTGKHTGHAAIRGNSPGLMPEDEVTVAELLRAAGYATGCFGKWGVGNPPPPDDPNRHGFDEFYGYVSMFHAHNFFPEFLIHNGQKTPLRNEVGKAWKDGDGRGVAVKRVDYVPELVTREALSFIEQHRQRPFFLYLAMNVPHANNEAGKAGMEVPEYAESVEDDWPLPEKGFATMIRNIDRDVGRVLEKVRQLGLERKTLVIFTSDNGPHQEGGHQMPFFDSNGPLKGMKRDLYEGGIRVPMIAWWPNRVPAGTVTDHISGFQDVLPTFAELAGIDPPSTDGISMVPTLLGEPGDQRRHPHLYWEFHEQGGKQAVVRGQWKAVRRNVAKDPNGPLELYDLARDLGEEHDLANQHPDLVAEFAAIMQREHVEPQP